MRNPVLTLLLMATTLCLAEEPGSADGPGASDRPRERTDANSRAAHRDLLAKTRLGVIDVYFVGDSITRRWGALDYPELLDHWRRSFHGWNAANFAWGGDRTQNILWRLQNGELEGVSPRVFVIQAGTNNLGDLADPAEQAASITAGVTAIVRACRAHEPDALIVLTALFPRRDHPEYNPVIADVNRRLAGLADGEGIRYIDINDRLRDDDGVLAPIMSEDGLHPGMSAYDIWAEALRPMLAETLGPPAAVDRAPPPTGDPAALTPPTRSDDPAPES